MTYINMRWVQILPPFHKWVIWNLANPELQFKHMLKWEFKAGWSHFRNGALNHGLPFLWFAMQRNIETNLQPFVFCMSTSWPLIVSRHSFHGHQKKKKKKKKKSPNGKLLKNQFFPLLRISLKLISFFLNLRVIPEKFCRYRSQTTGLFGTMIIFIWIQSKEHRIISFECVL